MRAALLTLAALAVATSCLAADAWKTFRDPAGIFSFEAPGPIRTERASRTMSDGATMQATVYEYGYSAPGEFTCAVGDFTFPNGRPVGPNWPAEMATQMRSDLKLGGVKPDADAAVPLKELMGWRITYKDGKGNQMSYRWFAAKNRLFEILCSLPPNATRAESATAERIADSFRVLPN
jgi:hypothetical protein